MINFIKAKPIWIKDKKQEMNLTAVFRCEFNCIKGYKYILKIAGATLYRVVVNGEFRHYGPAKAPHGYVRVDELILGNISNDDAYAKENKDQNKLNLLEGLNVLDIEVSAYNCYTFYTVNLAPFIQAEIIEESFKNVLGHFNVYDDDKTRVICHTDLSGIFRAGILTARVQKTMRYSYQRGFTEVYELDNSNSGLMKNPSATFQTGCSEHSDLIEILQHGQDYLPRELNQPQFKIKDAIKILESGNAIYNKQEKSKAEHYLQRNFIHEISDMIRGFNLDQIEKRPFEIIQDTLFTKRDLDPVEINIKDCTHYKSHEAEQVTPIALINYGEYVLFDMGLNNNGFILANVLAQKNSEIYFIFDEKLIDGKIDISSWECINIVGYKLKKSITPYSLESFESYGYRYIMCYVKEGEICLNSLGLREYSYPDYYNTLFQCNDVDIQAVFNAAVETYRQNTVDGFMDCPTRERAGWLCDSYFTAQAAQFFSGNHLPEKIFLENFVLAKEFPYIPKGMLPMCYPADHVNEIFIPQWAMWYIIQLEGYLRRNPNADKQTFKDLCYGLVEYFRPFLNNDGLLEKLEKWNFVEWSQANNWVNDVNYPTNMLYSKMIGLIGKWYHDHTLLNQSQKIKAKIIEQSFNGKFFIDNAVRDEKGNLSLTGNRSETCQYYAFFFDVADENDSKFKNLQDVILNVFGPERKAKNINPEIAYSNAFIGNYLRMELLLLWGKYNQVLNEIKAYFSKMAFTTGTLWEHDAICGSLNHGFASFAGVVILRALTGIKTIDERNKNIVIDRRNADIINLPGLSNADRRTIHRIRSSLAVQHKKESDREKPMEVALEAKIGTPHGVIKIKRYIKDQKVVIDYEIPMDYEKILG